MTDMQKLTKPPSVDISAANRANQLMVDRLIAQESLWSPPLIEAFRQTPRHLFLDRIYQHRKGNTWREVNLKDPGPDELVLAYSDRALTTKLSPGGPESDPVPISSSSQPSLMAQMLEDLQLREGLRTLEIGAGTGYNAALMAHVVGAGKVLSVDVDRQVLEGARDHLRAFPERQIRLTHTDGRLGYPAEAPYDRIVVTAAALDLQPAWLEQLAPGGLLLVPMTLGPNLSFVVRGTAKKGVFHGRLIRPAYFMPLRSEDDSGPAEPAGLPVPGPLGTIPSPWGDWLGQRRGRLSVLGFLQALAFYGWLRGLHLSYQNQGDSPLFGVSDLRRGCACWFGSYRWHISGEDGREVGETLWRAYLDAGAPWPTEFEFHADARGRLRAEGWETYMRQGPLCQQVWRLRPCRDRPAAL